MPRTAGVCTDTASSNRPGIWLVATAAGSRLLIARRDRGAPPSVLFTYGTPTLGHGTLLLAVLLPDW